MLNSIPADEIGRLDALSAYQILDTPPEFAYDALTELAVEICGCSVALISLVDERRQWFKSNYGLPAGYTECPREFTVCSTTLCSNDLIYVPDLTRDERFKNLPLVTGEPHLRFYCGMPLINRDGYALGTLCIVDFQPHELRPSQREAVRRLAQQAMAQLELRRQLIERDRLLKQLYEANQSAENARLRADALLCNLFPAQIAEELKAAGNVAPRYYESATILFADFKDFTRLTDGLEPARLIELLNQNFARFDEIADSHRLTTLRTVGDGCICVGGLPEPNRTHPLDACLTALQLQKFVAEGNRQREKLRLKPWHQRVGINTGPVVAGVIGTRRLTYDVWGNSVNLAQRLEQACEPGRVNISSSTLHHVASRFEAEARGSIEVKNLGAIDMYFLTRIKPDFSADAEGIVPNVDFWNDTGL